jgi:hypothetical protein
MMVDAILVLMQVGHEGDWSDRGVPEVVTGYDRSGTPAAAGAAWMFDHHPSPVGDDWRLLIWTKVRSEGWHIEKPDAVITPAMYRAAIAERGLGPAHSRRRRPRLNPQPITSKIRVREVEIGELVLVTQDRNNTTAPQSTGPWYIANRITADCVAVRVRGLSNTTRGADVMIGLTTPVGEIDLLAADQTVIPVDED